MILAQEYSDKNVTAWGGMQEMKMLIEKSGISKKIEELGLPEKKSNNSIDGVAIIESFWVSIWIGCFRFSHTAVVRLDEVLRQIFGWKRVASGTTFGRFFKSFSESRSHQFFIDLYSWFFEQLQFDNYTLDVNGSKRNLFIYYCTKKISIIARNCITLCGRLISIMLIYHY